MALYAQDHGSLGQFCSSLSNTPIEIGVMGVFHALSQEIDNQFCASADGGKSFWRPSRRPLVNLAPLGDYGGGLHWPFRQVSKKNEVLIFAENIPLLSC